MQQPRSCGWACVDVGKGHHWESLMDEAGTTVWSAKVVNDPHQRPHQIRIVTTTVSLTTACLTEPALRSPPLAKTLASLRSSRQNRAVSV